jgi:hypothetical protein
MSGEAKTMGKLEEKTKKWGCYHCSCCRFYHGLAKGCELPRCAYILVSVAQQEIDKLKTFRDNAYKKWCDSQAELERERGLLKQTCDEIRSKLKFLDYEQYHGDLKQSLNPTLKEIHQLLEELLRE